MRLALIATDLCAAFVGWGLLPSIVVAVALPHSDVEASVAFLTVAAALTPLLLWRQRLYSARVCAVRSVELHRLARAVIAAALISGLVIRPVDVDELVVAGLSAMTTLASLALGRGIYRSWLRQQRQGRGLMRRMVLIGADDEGASLHRVFGEHPELGFEFCGVIGPEPDAPQAADLGLPWLGTPAHAERLMREVDATGAVLVARALPVEEVNWLVRCLPAAGFHLHVSSGVHGIASNRLWALPLAYEPLLYVEAAQLRAWQGRLKRWLDIAIGGVVLIVSLPLLGAAAAAIKLEDGGPALFRQQRVGQNGELFWILKMRTMAVDAEGHLEAVMVRNQRTGGPLFKVADDPRVTRVGRFLRRTSLDELPQVINVLRGEMSLVGPRPALPEETASFDTDLQRRLAVQPGVTGLWQVEARDNPAFGPYRRLDLYYVENWSPGLDLAILARTAATVAARALSALPRPRAAAMKRHPAVGHATLD